MSKGTSTNLSDRRASGAHAVPSLSEAKLSERPNAAPEKPSSLDSLSFSKNTSIERAPAGLLSRPRLQQLLSRRPTTRGSSPAKQKVVARATQRSSSPLTVIDKFMRWLESQIKALIEKFFAVAPALPFGRTSLQKKKREREEKEEQERLLALSKNKARSVETAPLNAGTSAKEGPAPTR